MRCPLANARIRWTGVCTMSIMQNIIGQGHARKTERSKLRQKKEEHPLLCVQAFG
jgi:hypothetical protein